MWRVWFDGVRSRARARSDLLNDGTDGRTLPPKATKKSERVKVATVATALKCFFFDSRYCCPSEQRAPWHRHHGIRHQQRDATRGSLHRLWLPMALWHRHGRMRGGKGNREESSRVLAASTPRRVPAACNVTLCRFLGYDRSRLEL